MSASAASPRPARRRRFRWRLPTARLPRTRPASEFQIGVLTGASTGPSLDGALSKAKAISFRTPYQTDANLRDRINAGKTRFFDMHLSLMPQVTRYGFLGPGGCGGRGGGDVTAGGGIVLTSGVGAAPTFCNLAEKVICRTEPPSSAGHARDARHLRAGRSAVSQADSDLHAFRPHRFADHHRRPGEDRRRGGNRSGRRSARLQRDQPAHRSDRPQRGRVSGGATGRRHDSQAVPADSIRRGRHRQFGARRAGQASRASRRSRCTPRCCRIRWSICWSRSA